MRYQGNTLTIPYTNSGFNYSPNLDDIPAHMFVHPSRNLMPSRNGIEPRYGTSKVNTTAISSAPRGMGGFDYRLYDGTRFTVFSTDDGKIWKNTTTTIKTGRSTSRKSCFINFRNTLIEVNGKDIPQTWDGAAAGTSDMASVPTDWTGSNYPGQILIRNNGLSRRLIALSFSGAASRENIYVAPSGSSTFPTLTTTVIPIDIGDGVGPVGAAEAAGEVIIFGKQRAFILDDSDEDAANWGISPAPWVGGVAHWRLLVQADNDLYAMTPDGYVYSASTVQEFGNYKRNPLMAESYIHEWIKDFVDLTQMDNFHGIFDRTRRCVMYWVVRRGSSAVNTALCYWIDKGVWTIEDNQNNPSGYDASASFEIEASAGVFELQTIDYSGYLWKLNQPTKSDDSLAFTAVLCSPNLSMGTDDQPKIRIDKYIRRMIQTIQTSGNVTLGLQVRVDGQVAYSGNIFINSQGIVFGVTKFGAQAVFRSPRFQDLMTTIRSRGKRANFQITSNIPGQDFIISKFQFDHEDLGIRP